MSDWGMNARQREDLDRHITGNYGEDQLGEDHEVDANADEVAELGKHGYDVTWNQRGYEVKFNGDTIAHYFDWDHVGFDVAKAISKSQLMRRCALWVAERHMRGYNASRGTG